MADTRPPPSAPPPIHYVVFRDGGATLVYSGADTAEYEAVRRLLDAEHAGAVVGMSMMGRERWVIVAYHTQAPNGDYIRRRREGGLFGLAWEPASRNGA
ncbi:MAG: hypothetical protein ACRDJE_23890 [Dehalococcoidia bacterium]